MYVNLWNCWSKCAAALNGDFNIIIFFHDFNKMGTELWIINLQISLFHEQSSDNEYVDLKNAIGSYINEFNIKQILKYYLSLRVCKSELFKETAPVVVHYSRWKYFTTLVPRYGRHYFMDFTRGYT